MKKLPLILAISSAILSNTVIAQTTTLSSLAKRVEALETENANDLTFYGYMRYGLNYDSRGRFLNNQIAADGQVPGNLAVGRLGNEFYGGEFGWIKPFVGINGTQWDMHLFLDDYGSGIRVKKFYAGVSHVFASQPDLYIWAGRDFQQRPQEGLNDYFFMVHDGQGAGFKQLDLKYGKMDLAVVQAVDNSIPTTTAGNTVQDNYAVSGKFSIPLAENVELDLLANYGFSEISKQPVGGEKAALVGAMLNINGHKIGLRYGRNADNSVLSIDEGLNAFYGSYQYLWEVNDKITIESLAGVHILQNRIESRQKAQDRKNYSLIVRPTYAWNDIHSTWLEAGYSMVDYDKANKSNDAWKVTLSQNIAIDTDYLERPMLRFFVSAGSADNKVNSTTGDLFANTMDTSKDALIFGAMVEAWW